MEGQTGYLVEAANARAGQGRASPRTRSRPAAGRSPSTSTRSSRSSWRSRSTSSWRSKLDRKKQQGRRDRPGRRHLGRPEDRPGRRAVRRRRRHRALAIQRHPPGLPARLDLQAASSSPPPWRTAPRPRTASRSAPTPIYDGTSKRPVVGSDTPFAPENEDDQRLRPGHRPAGDEQAPINSVFAQMVVDVDPEQGEEDRARHGHDGRQGLARERPAMRWAPWAPPPGTWPAVYATLDNHGKKVTPTIVKSAEQRGRKADPPDPIGDQVISREAADTVTKALTGVVDDGTGSGRRPAPTTRRARPVPRRTTSRPGSSATPPSSSPPSPCSARRPRTAPARSR